MQDELGGMDAIAELQRLRSALRIGRVGDWEWHLDSDAARWSPYVYELLGLPVGSGREVGAKFLSTVHPEDLPGLTAAFRRLIESGAGSSLEHRFRVMHADGTARWLISRAHALVDPGGLVTIQGINIDVSAEVSTQEHLHAVASQSEKNSQMLHALLAHAPVGIAIAYGDPPQIQAVSRLATEQVEGDTPAHDWDVWQVYHLDGQSRALPEEMALARACRGQIIRDEEWLIRIASGALLPVICDAGPIRDAAGRLQGGIVAWRDITAVKQTSALQKRLLESSQEAQAAAERLNAGKDVFLASVSHELRNPLNALLGWTEILRSPAVGDALRARAGEVIHRNTTLLMRLVNDLLDASSIASGTFKVHPEMCDLATVVQSAVDSMQITAAEAGVRLGYHHPPRLPIRCDGTRMEQVVLNLVGNALKFSPSGNEVEVTLSATSEGGAELRISDAGAGIEPAELEAIFERFHQASNAPTEKRHAGLGLGLAIARHVVELHGGRIWAQSAGLGLGATFHVALPPRSSV